MAVEKPKNSEFFCLTLQPPCLMCQLGGSKDIQPIKCATCHQTSSSRKDGGRKPRVSD